MAIQVIRNNDSIYDYWFEDGQLWGRRKSNKIPFKINSERAYEIISPLAKKMGIDSQKPTSTLVYHPAKYREMPTAKVVTSSKKGMEEEKETVVEKGKQFLSLLGNGISRKLALFFNTEPEHTSKRMTPKALPRRTKKKIKKKKIQKLRLALIVTL